MSYYPILKAPGVQGWTTLCNFAPNNWETTRCPAQLINVTWPSTDGWMTKNLGVLAPNAMRTVTSNEVADVVPAEAVALLSLTISAPPSQSETLPELDTLRTMVPAWRATLGLSSAVAQASYQGEIDPFPPKGTLLTFGPFMQFGAGIENFLILLNIEGSPKRRQSEVEVYNADGMTLMGRFEVRNNAANIIPLDGLGFGVGDLPAFICRGLTGIPLYFSRTTDGAHMSLEHTHPPGSLVVHGRRWEAQKMLKNVWFKKVASCR